jgi:Fe-S oxidoreductase
MSYGTIKSILVLLGLVITFWIFGRRIYQLLWVNLRRGQPSDLSKNWAERLKSILVYVAAQKRLFRFLIPGTAHFFIFWGFVLLSLTILQAIIEGLTAFIEPPFIIPFLDTFGPLAFVQDIFAVMVIVSVVYAIYVRVFINPERYKGSHREQGILVLVFIFTIMVSLLIMNGIRINLGVDPLANWRPVSTFVGGLFAGLPETTQVFIEEISYWIHLIVVLIFLTELPIGKHFHVITSVPAVFLRNLNPVGTLPPAPSFNSDFGVSKVEQFTWRQMLDFYTCTECGRCQDVCPAYNSGLPLSPKLLMMNLRDNLKERGVALSSNTGNGILSTELIGEVIGNDVLWACTSCLACDQECPLFIEHVSPIVDMRRYLVTEGDVDDELQDALTNLARYGNSFGKSARARARWSRKIEPKIKDARKEQVQYLWLLGDYASFSPTLTEITQKTVEVFQKAQVDFGILYEGEHNSGNDVRRVGEEGLFEMLVDNNLAELEKSRYEVIVTTDPHTYNTLKNEYPKMNGKSNKIIHYSELLDQLIASGQLKLTKDLGKNVTYHDPCYLGRYNGIYDSPRRVIEATGCNIIEMPRNKDKAYCCGAGGGRIWMPEGDVSERPSESRIDEAVSLNDVTEFIVACPKDVTMYQDAVKTTGNEEKIQVKDLIELVHAAI